jgi:hypothetical protein
LRRAEGAGLDGKAADQAMIGETVIAMASFIVQFLENAHPAVTLL